MVNTWTPEQRQRQAEKIQQWRPWLKSTGPRTAKGKAKVSRNAYTGGHWKLARDLARALKEQRQMLKRLV